MDITNNETGIGLEWNKMRVRKEGRKASSKMMKTLGNFQS